MATKDKKPTTKTKAATTKVTRIKATDASAKSAKKATVKADPTPVVAEKPSRRNPLRATGDYFKGAWYELRQVRWPNRKATWSLTGAMLVFTAFFVVLILLLDALFKYLFELILG